MGDYWGAVSIGYNKTLVSNPPKTWQDLLKPEYKGKVAMNGSPLTSGSAIGGRDSPPALAQRRLAQRTSGRASTSSRR